MSGTLAATWDMTMEQGALFVRSFIVENEDIESADMEMIVKQDGATDDLFTLVVGAGQITLDYGTHDIDGESVTGTLVTITRTAAQTAAIPLVRNARHSIWDAATGEHYATGSFENVKTVLT